MDVLFSQMGSIANISLFKKICLAILFFKDVWLRIVVTANSLYEFSIAWSLKRFLTKNIQNIESDVSYYIGAGHVLLRETFVKVGGYDTDLFYGLEELDISSEIIKENKKIIYYPEVEIIHEPKKSVVDKRSKLKAYLVLWI